MIKIYSDPRHKFKKKELVRELDEYLLKETDDQEYLLNIILVGIRKMIKIASTYKGKKSALPVLSFSYLNNDALDRGEEDKSLIGEIFICYPQAVALAAEKGKRVDTTLYDLATHGIRNILIST